MRNPQIYEEASEWFVRMRDGDDVAGLRTEFMEWLRRSPEHVRAYLDIAGVWLQARHVEVDSEVDLAERVAMAKADKGVAELAPRADRSPIRWLENRRRLALAASVLVVTAGFVAALGPFGGSTYSTDVGEQRSIALGDGSTIDLNSQSRVRVRLDDKKRKIELLQGQALFHVAKDPTRPFIVHVDKAVVRAVGTVFDVYRKNAGTIVTVVEGRVGVTSRPQRLVPEQRPEPGQPSASGTVPSSVAREPHGRGELLLEAGEQLVVNLKIPAELKPVNISAATAWTRRELVFEFTPLAEAVEEFNRYNERQLIVEGETLRKFKVSAVFRSTDSGSLVRYLEKMPGVRIEEGEYAVLITSDRKN